MKNKLVVRFDFKKAILYLFVVFLILDGNSMYHALAYRDFHFPLICAFLSALLVILDMRSLRKKSVALAFALMVYFAAYFLIKQEDVAREAYLCIFIVGVPCWVLLFQKMSGADERKEVFYAIEGVMAVLTVIALFFWTFGSLLKLFSTNMSVVVSWGKLREYSGYFGLHFNTNISNSFGLGLPINSGIFAEGPMFNLWLCISLATELFLRKTLSKKRCAIFLLGILTTLSTTGVFFIAMSFALKYITTFKDKMGRMKLFMVIFAAILLPVAASALKDIFLLKVRTSSYLIRLQDYIAGFKVWRESPLLGSGYGMISALQKYVRASAQGNVGFSNSITAILGTGGLWNFSVYLLSILAPLVRKGEDRANIVAFTLCYAFLSVIVIFFARFLMAVFIAYGLSFLLKKPERARA